MFGVERSVNSFDTIKRKPIIVFKEDLTMKDTSKEIRRESRKDYNRIEWKTVVLIF